jgi:hypothetical protein
MRPAHWCQQCHGKRHGKLASVVVFVAMILVGALIVVLVLA